MADTSLPTDSRTSRTGPPGTGLDGCCHLSFVGIRLCTRRTSAIGVCVKWLAHSNDRSEFITLLAAAEGWLEDGRDADALSMHLLPSTGVRSWPQTPSPFITPGRYQSGCPTWCELRATGLPPRSRQQWPFQLFRRASHSCCCLYCQVDFDEYIFSYL